MLASAIVLAAAMSSAPASDDRDIVAALDLRYQAAVKANDAAAMAEILHDDMILVVGRGDVVTRADLLREAGAGRVAYSVQDEEPGSQTVRMYGRDTAVVTAKLWLKYTAEGKAFDRKLWFSDTYVRTPGGWKYAFGQASLALPDAG